MQDWAVRLIWKYSDAIYSTLNSNVLVEKIELSFKMHACILFSSECISLFMILYFNALL